MGLLHGAERDPVIAVLTAPGVTLARARAALTDDLGGPSLELARRAAKTEHRAQAGTVDLLTGLLTVVAGKAVRVLRSLGVDPEALVAEMRPRAVG